VSATRSSRRRSPAGSDERERAERQIAALEAMIARLTDSIEQGQPAGDRLKQRRAELEALRATLAVPPPTLSKEGDRPAPLRDRCAGHVINGDPVGVRAVMRKMGIDRDVDGLADLSRLVVCTKGGPAPCEDLPLRLVRTSWSSEASAA